METLQQRIDDVTLAVRASELPMNEALARIAGMVEPRTSSAHRRSDGSFFTADDVALWLARRALGALLLTAAGVEARAIDDLLAANDDLISGLADHVRDSRVHAAVSARLATIVVLDPTCGAGALLGATWTQLRDAQAQLDTLADQHGWPRGARVSARQLHGVDRDAAAVVACSATLALLAGDDTAAPQITCADSTLPATLPAADLVIGNPPYVRAAPASAPADLRTGAVPNLSAWVVERALTALRDGGRIAMVLPISTICTSAFEPARAVWRDRCDRVHVSSFDAIPATLFPGVVQRIALLEGAAATAATRDTDAPRWFTTRFHRWKAHERAELLDAVRFVAMPPSGPGGSLAKIGSEVERGLLERVHRHAPAERFHERGSRAGSTNVVHYKRRWSYFLLFTDFMPPIWNEDGSERAPTEFKTLAVRPQLDAHVLLAVYSSSLFWWYFSVFTDNRNVNVRDLAAFPVPQVSAAQHDRLAVLGVELSQALRACAEVRTCTYASIGTIRNTYFRQGMTRPVIDRIDVELAAAYGFDDAQLTFVLEFERRFRAASVQ